LNPSETDHALRFFKTVRIFQDTDEATLVKLLPLMRQIDLPAEEIVVRKGDPGGAVFFIEHGEVVVRDGDLLLDKMGAGDMFGEYSLIDTGKRSATVETLCPSRLYKLEQEDFIPLISADLGVLRSFLTMFVGRLRRHDAVLRELTEKSEQILQQKAELERLNEEKSRLMYILAHDVRNPLNSALSLTHLVADDPEGLSQDQKECLDIAIRAMNRIQQLVIEILDSQASRGSGKAAEPGLVNLATLLREILLQFRPQTHQKKLKPELKLEEVHLRGEEHALKQIFENLISNAIKYSPPERHIFISLYRAHGMAIAEVRDEGPGLTEEDQRKLFGEFQRLSARPTGGEDSYGLGLSIVKKNVDQLGGEVWCESTPGQGASFKVAFRV
jgi:signal transduction histidine kinase